MSKIKYVAYRGQGFVIIKVGENGITDITIQIEAFSPCEGLPDNVIPFRREP